MRLPNLDRRRLLTTSLTVADAEAMAAACYKSARTASVGEAVAKLLSELHE